MDLSIFVFVFSIVGKLVYSESGGEYHMCTAIPDIDCITDECLRIHEQPCFHGDCTEKGACFCRPCWAGSFCNESVNHHHPVFQDPSYIAIVAPDARQGSLLREVFAFDADSSQCYPNTECDCADVYYLLKSIDKISPKLTVDDLGGIYLDEDGPFAPGVYEYKLSVRNQDGLQGSNAPLTIFVEPTGGSEWDTVVKSRQLRAAPDVTGLTNLEANSLDCSIELDIADAAIQTVKPGDDITIIFTATFPANKYVEDVIIEVFTDDINGTFAFLCQPQVTVGANLELDTARLTPAMESNTGYLISTDTATLSIGTVTNRGATATPADNAITVTFKVTVVDDPTILDGDTYWVSAGIEHHQGHRLWIGQLGFNVQRAPENITATAVSLDGQITIPVGQPHKFTLDIQTYKRFSNMSASVATADAEHNSICRMEICGFGGGFCVDKTKTKASYTLENSTSWGHNGAASIPFDVISYGGALNDAVNSVITLDVIVLIPDTAIGAGGQTLDATVTENGVDTIGSFTYTPAAAVNLVDPPGSVLGVTATASCTGTPCELFTGQAVNFEVTLTVPTGTTFTPVQIKFVSDFLADGTTPAIGSCDGHLVSFSQIDDDIACLGAWINQANRLVTSEAQGPVVNLGGVMNLGYSGNSVATIKLGATLTFNTNVVAGTVYNMNVQVYAAGTLASTTTLGVKLSATPAVLPTWPSGGPAPAVLNYKVTYPVDSPDVPPGGMAVLQIQVIPEHSTQCPYILEVGASSATMRVLDYRVSYAGSGFICNDRDAWASMVGTITPGDGNALYDTSEMDLGLVKASRWSANIEAKKEDSIIVEATVQLSEDRATVADASLHPIAMSALICTTRLWVAEGSVRANYSSFHSLQAPTVNTLAFAAPVVDTVTRGGSSKIHHTVTLKETSCFTYVINYRTGQTWMNVTDVQVVSVGDHLPGLRLKPPTAVFGSHSEGHSAEVDLGSVCNILRETPLAGDADTIANMTFVLEISVEFADSNDMDRGSWGEVTATMTVGNGDTTQNHTKVIQYKANLPKTKFQLECPSSANEMKPGEVETCTVTTNMIDDELDILFEIETMLNSTAALHIMAVKVTSIGRNIAGDFDTNTVVNLTSGDVTTQNNRAAVIGIARNTFTHLNVSGGTYMDGDNDIIISITFQMTDAIVNEPGSLQRMEIGASVGTSMVWVSYHDFTVERDGTEVPALDVGFSHTAGDNLRAGDSVFYHVNVSHNDVSTGEPINLKIRLNLPIYVKYMNFASQNANERFPVPTYNVSRGSVILSIGRLFFTDSITFTIETTIDSSFEFRKKETWRGTTPLQVAYQMTDRAGSTTPPGDYLSTSMKFVTYNFTVTPVLDSSSAAPCISPVALGMEDGTIQECQITSSFQPNPAAKASHARLNGASAWKTEARGGPFLESRWLKVDLGRLVTLTSVSTQGGASGDIAKFDLLYSVNDALYKKAVPTDEFNHHKNNPSPAANDIVQHNLGVAVAARYVVIQLTDYDFNTAGKLYNMLRVEFHGCDVGTPDAAPCPDPDTALHEYDRGFTVAGSTLFVCDSQTHFNSGFRREIYSSAYAFNFKIKPKTKCFVTPDGSMWDAMPTRVHNVVGYLPSDDNAIFAIFENSPGYAKGNQFGSSWTMIPTSEYQAAAAKPDFVAHKSVPFAPQAGFVEETVDNFKATFVGISQLNGANWVPILEWNGCCTPQCKLTGVSSC